MTRLINAVGLVAALIVTVLGLIVAGLVSLAALMVIGREPGAALGALVFAAMVAVPTLITFGVARAIRLSRAVQAPPPPPPPMLPGTGGQPGADQASPLGQDQALYNPYDLR